MADLSLRIKADFDEAARQFKALADASEDTRAKMEKFAEGFKSESVDKFIDRQKLAGAAITAAKGEAAAMEAQQAAYRREIERLIKSGLDPESEAVQRLAREQEILKNKIKEANDIKKAQAEIMKGVERAAKACYAAIGAGLAAVGAMTQKMAEAGDQYAKTSMLVGMTAEQFQELEYAAKTSGVDNLADSLKKLNKSVADVKSGSGSLTNALKETNPQLLAQIKNASSNEQAFNLLINAIKKAPDEFSKAELAQAAFGKSGTQMILMAEKGTTGIEALREEARKYGLISNAAAKNAEGYIDAQTRIKKSLEGVRNQLTEGLLPGITETMNKIAAFISGIDNWDRIIKIAAMSLGALTAGLTAFVLASKATVAINAITAAMKGLNTALKGNIIIAIAAAILTVLVPALIWLVKNWDTVQTYISQGVARLEYGFRWFASQVKEKFLTAVNGVKIGFLSLAEIIVTNVLGSVAKLLETLGKIPGVGESFKKAAEAVKGFNEGFRQSAQEAKNASAAAVRAAHEEQQAAERALKDKLAGIDAQAAANRAAIEERKKQSAEQMKADEALAAAEIEQTKRAEAAITAAKVASFKERLQTLADTEKAADKERLDAASQFLQQQAELQSDDFNGQISFLLEKKAELLSLYEEGSAEREAIERALALKIGDIQRKQADFERKLLEEKLGAYTQFTGGVGRLLELAAGKNQAAAVGAKALAAAEAGINSYLAFTKTLASMPAPLNYVAAGGVLAAGVAQQIKILSTPIPGAETGGRFVVPDLSPRVDGVGLRVNAGETVDVTPRGESGGGAPAVINLIVDGYVLAQITNRQIRAGEIYDLRLQGNL